MIRKCPTCYRNRTPTIIRASNLIPKLFALKPTLEVIVDQILPFGWSQILCTVWIAYQGNCIVFNRLQSEGLIFAHIIATWHVFFFSTWSWKLCHLSWRFFFFPPTWFDCHPNAGTVSESRHSSKSWMNNPTLLRLICEVTLELNLSLSLSLSLSYI